jgi:serine/threonine protein kinase
MMRRRKQRTTFSEQELCVYAREMANGLAVLHRMKIIHRDVKAANFFLAEGDKVKLGDMNVSAISRNGMASTKIGTPFYTSPEIWLELPYSTAADMWAFGCLLYEMVSFTHPFSGRDLGELKQKVLEGKFKPLGECPSGIRDIIERCLVVDPNGRLTAEDVIKNDYLKTKYNEHRQRTMEKDPMKLRERHITCAKILKEISQGSCQMVRNNLPPSNYTNKKNLKNIEKRGASLGESFKKSKKQVSLRLATLINIYNLK